MRVMITGARGQVGHELVQGAPAGFEVTAFDSSTVDITNPGAVVAAIVQTQPQLIINAAAYTAVDKAEQAVEQAWAVNCAGVGHLAVEAEALGIPVFHLSTDYVFAGDARTPYREDDPCAPAGVYGASKHAGEEALAGFCSRHLILRTSWVFGAHGNNFVKTMLRLGASRDELGVVADQHGCPTSARSLAETLWRLAAKYRDEGELPWGIYHCSNAPATTWHGFAEAVFDQAARRGLLARRPRVNPIATRDYPTPAKRPAWSVLDCSRLEALQGQPQPAWIDELDAVLETLDVEAATRRAAACVVTADLAAAIEASCAETTLRNTTRA